MVWRWPPLPLYKCAFSVGVGDDAGALGLLEPAAALQCGPSMPWPATTIGMLTTPAAACAGERYGSEAPMLIVPLVAPVTPAPEPPAAGWIVSVDHGDAPDHSLKSG